MKRLKSDSGYSLGLVLIFVLAVGTVLGSVMHVTELSADAQGRGVDQLKAANSIAGASAEVIKEITDIASAGAAFQVDSAFSNCGLPEHEGSVRVSCSSAANQDDKLPHHQTITFTASNGEKTQKVFTIYPSSTVSGSQRVSESEE